MSLRQRKTEMLIDESDAIEYAFEKGWTDGLPVVPPTRDRVRSMLEAVGKDDAHVVGAVALNGHTVTAGFVAANAVMSGCKPEYFNIVMTAIEAVLDPAFNIGTVATSTGGASVCIIVSGPQAGDIGMNSAHNLLGPGNRANATIGRAVHLTISNALGFGPETLVASSIGHPGKYTLCFAENEALARWEPLRCELGYAVHDTTVTIMATEGPRQIANQLNEAPEKILLSVAAAMKAASTFIVGKGGQGVVVLGYEHAQAVCDGGWSRRQAREFLVEQSRVSPSELEAGGNRREQGAQHDLELGVDGKLPTFKSAEDILLVTGGGPGAGWSAYIPAWAPRIHSRSITRRVRAVDEALPDCGPDSCDISGLSNPVA